MALTFGWLTETWVKFKENMIPTPAVNRAPLCKDVKLLHFHNKYTFTVAQSKIKTDTTPCPTGYTDHPDFPHLPTITPH